MLEMTL